VFFIAVKNGYVEFVRLFLKLDAKLRKMINMPDASNMTPLYYAVKNNQKEMVQLLLKCGAKVSG
jgi:ankyrin repeat protein